MARPAAAEKLRIKPGPLGTNAASVNGRPGDVHNLINEIDEILLGYGAKVMGDIDIAQGKADVVLGIFNAFQPLFDVPHVADTEEVPVYLARLNNSLFHLQADVDRTDGKPLGLPNIKRW